MSAYTYDLCDLGQSEIGFGGEDPYPVAMEMIVLSQI